MGLVGHDISAACHAEETGEHIVSESCLFRNEIRSIKLLDACMSLSILGGRHEICALLVCAQLWADL